MRLNLNQQSSGDAWMWHKNLIDSLIPIVDCGVHYVDVMCQLTGAKPVRVHGIGAEALGRGRQAELRPPARDLRRRLGRLVRGGLGADDVGDRVLREGHRGAEGRRSRSCPQEEARSEADALSGSADIDKHTKTDAIRLHHAAVGPDKHFLKPDEVFSMEDEPGPSGALRPRAGVLPARDPRGPRPDGVDGGGGELAPDRARRRTEHRRGAGHPARLNDH